MHLKYYWYVMIRDQEIAAGIGPDLQGHLRMWWELQLAHVACSCSLGLIIHSVTASRIQ